MKTTYRKLYKFETQALAEAWIQKTNPAKKIDIYLEEFNSFFYWDVNTGQLTEQGTGSSDSFFSYPFNFISADNLDENNEYFLSSDNIGKVNIFYVDSGLYPNAKVKFPEGYIGTNEEVNGKSFYLIFLDAGTFNRSYDGHDIKPATLFDMINGSQDQDADSTVGGDIIKLLLYNDTESLKTATIIEGIDGIIYDNLDSTYKTINKYFLDNISTNLDYVIHYVENGDTITLTKGVLNIIYDEAKITAQLNINIPDYQSTSNYEILFYSQFQNISYFNGLTDITQFNSFDRAPKFASFKERCIIQSYGDGTPNNWIIDIKSIDEKHYFIGQVSYIDVNDGAAASEIQFSPLLPIPVGWYIDRFSALTAVAFDGPGLLPVEADITTISSDMIYPSDKFIRSSAGNRISFTISYNGGDIFGAPISDLTVRMNWGVGVNPKDYTQGRIDVYAILKRMPSMSN